MSASRDLNDELTRDPEVEAAQAAETDRAKRKQEVEDIKWLMAHAQGRRFVARLLAETGLFRTSFHTSGSVMALNEGRKQIGYFVQGELMDIDPNAYMKMLKEFSNG